MENRISSGNRKIDVLGATVDEKLAVIAAPLAAFLTLLYWLLVIRHLKALLRTSVDEANALTATHPLSLVLATRQNDHAAGAAVPQRESSRPTSRSGP